jgi:hypothetical protein
MALNGSRRVVLNCPQGQVQPRWDGNHSAFPFADGDHVQPQPRGELGLRQVSRCAPRLDVGGGHGLAGQMCQRGGDGGLVGSEFSGGAPRRAFGLNAVGAHVHHGGHHVACESAGQALRQCCGDVGNQSVCQCCVHVVSMHDA